MLEDLLAIKKTDIMIRDWITNIKKIKAATQAATERGHGDMVAFLRVVGRPDIAEELSKTFKHVRAPRRDCRMRVESTTSQNSADSSTDDAETDRDIDDDSEEPYVVTMLVEMDDAHVVKEYLDILVTLGPCPTPSSDRVHVFERARCDRQADAEFVRQRLVKDMYDVLSAQGHRDPMKATYSKFVDFEDTAMYTDVSGVSDSIFVNPMGGGDSVQIRDKQVDDLRVEIYKSVTEHEKTWKAKSTRRMVVDDWAMRGVPCKPAAYARWMERLHEGVQDLSVSGTADDVSATPITVVATSDTAFAATEPVPDESKISEMASRIEKLERVCQKLAYAALAAH
jgi:hypothetical protein